MTNSSDNEEKSYKIILHVSFLAF